MIPKHTVTAILSTFAFLLLSAQTAQAHLPYLASGKTEIIITEPEISKAFYGWLDGEPAAYSISSDKPFDLYLNLLSPRIDGAKLDYSAQVFQDGGRFANLGADDSLWLVTYEPFGNDYYAKGPEYETQAPAGDYRIEIYNSGNSGNYVLAVGKTEDLSLGQFLRTLLVLPQVKEEFWGKPAWQAYNNFMGLAAFIVLVIAAMAAYFALSFVQRRRLKKWLDKEYGKYKNNGNARRKDRGGLSGGQGI